MGLFGRLFSKKTDPELERFAKAVELALARSKKRQGLQKMAVFGAEVRCRFFNLLEKFEAETGKIGFAIADTVECDGCIFIDPELTNLIKKQDDSVWLESALLMAFPTRDCERQWNENWPAIIEIYHAKPNTEDVLYKKAQLLSQYIILHLGIATDIYEYMIESDLFKDSHELSEKQEELVKLEEAAVWYRFIDEKAHWYIRPERKLFMDYFEDAFGYHLALQGASSDAIASTILDRMDEYGPYRKWISHGEEPEGGTVLWEAGKHLLEAMGLPPDFLFKRFFNIQFLETVNRVFLYELLTGKKAPNK